MFETEVEIQPLMAFSIMNAIIALALFLLAAFLLYRFIKAKTKPVPHPIAQPIYRPMPKNVRDVYIEKLEKVKQALISGKIDSRAGSEQVSKILREYMAKAYNVNISHLTLAELQKQGLSDVASVIDLCYEDEFPRIPYNKSIQAIEQAQKLIGGRG